MEKQEREQIAKAQTIADTIGDKLKDAKDISPGIDLVSLARSLSRRRASKMKKK